MRKIVQISIYKSQGSVWVKQAKRVKRVIRMIIILAFAAMGMTAAIPAHAADPPADLQMLIDHAALGDVVTIPAGTYQGPLIVKKPLSLIADGKVTINGAGTDPVITVEADHVSIKGLQIVDERERKPRDPTVLLTGSDHVLRDISIRTNGTGVLLQDASRNRIEGVVIEGLTPAQGITGTTMRGNGVDLRKSHDNEIVSSKVINMFDAFYVEESHRNLVHQNEAQDSRYGYHLMFTENNVLSDNIGNHNVTGAMVMGSKGSIIRNNAFSKQSENVNSQGILLFDETQAVVENNRIEGNRVGIYVESSSDNSFSSNELIRNFIGIQMIKSSNNELYRNDFLANVIQAQATDSADNQMSENFWDDLQGVDLAGTGRSDLSYQINPFYITLTGELPQFQVFFGSPGMTFLESLFHHPNDSWLQDRSPLMQPYGYTLETGQGQDRHVLWLGTVLLIVSVFVIFKMGVIRK